jgi:hypothetical protein
LSESVANPRRPDLFHLDRISTCAESDASLFFEIEMMPRLRVLRNRLSRNTTPVRAVRTKTPADRQGAVDSDDYVKAADGREERA